MPTEISPPNRLELSQFTSLFKRAHTRRIFPSGRMVSTSVCHPAVAFEMASVVIPPVTFSLQRSTMATFRVWTVYMDSAAGGGGEFNI